MLRPYNYWPSEVRWAFFFWWRARGVKSNSC